MLLFQESPLCVDSIYYIASYTIILHRKESPTNLKTSQFLLSQQVRVMSEPSNMPPLWTSAYVASLARGELFRNIDGSLSIQQSSVTPCTGDVQPSVPKCEDVIVWEAAFVQPASDYLAFRAKLDKQSVSLENVIIRELENHLVGTVKVKNLAYDKSVTIRMTSDDWTTFQDVGCTFVEQPGLCPQTAVRNLYDTFRFRIALPDSDARQVEFCVRYCTDGQDYWDNNAGANYVVKKKRDVSAVDYETSTDARRP